MIPSIVFVFDPNCLVYNPALHESPIPSSESIPVIPQSNGSFRPGGKWLMSNQSAMVQKE